MRFSPGKNMGDYTRYNDKQVLCTNQSRGTKSHMLVSKLYSGILDCKTVVFGRFRKARSAVSVILECEAREPHTPASLPILPRRFYTRSRAFVRIWTHRHLPSLVFAKNTTVLQSSGIPKQRQIKVDWYELLWSAVLLCNLHPSMCDFVPRDRIVRKGLLFDIRHLFLL